MLKQIVALIILSLVLTVTIVYAHELMQYLITAHDWVAQMLRDVFSGGQVGNISRELIALLVVPVTAGIALAALYYLVKRHWFPYFMEVVWVVWLVQASAIIVTYVG